MILQEDIEFLEHFGVKGMQWGVRSSHKSAVKKENKAFKAEEKAAAKGNSSFKREVKLTRKSKGISGKNFEPVVSKHSELLTGRVKGTFKDSTGKPISTAFANAVVNKAHTKNDRTRRAQMAAGGLVVAGILSARGNSPLSIAIGGLGGVALVSSVKSNAIGARPPLVKRDK